MKFFKLLALIILIFIITNCEKKDDFVNKTIEAQVINFIPEKCYCCWGWIIDINKPFAIKADSIPNLSPSDTIVYPIKARITIGNKIRDCTEYKIDMTPLPDYYEIKQFTLIK